MRPGTVSHLSLARSVTPNAVLVESRHFTHRVDLRPVRTSDSFRNGTLPRSEAPSLVT